PDRDEAPHHGPDRHHRQRAAATAQVAEPAGTGYLGHDGHRRWAGVPGRPPHAPVGEHQGDEVHPDGPGLAAEGGAASEGDSMMQRDNRVAARIAALFVLLVGSLAWPADAPPRTGLIEGVVRFTGTVPPPRKLATPDGPLLHRDLIVDAK